MSAISLRKVLVALLAVSSIASAAPETPQLQMPVAANGLTADAAAKRALVASPAVALAGESVSQSRTEAKVAAAAFAPRVDLRASYTRLSQVDQPPIEFGGQSFTLFPQILDQYALRGSITFPVSDYFLTIAPGYKASKKAAEVNAYMLYAQREVAAFTARQYYYAYARSVAAEAVAKTSVQQLESHVQELDALVKAGTTTRGDLMQARAQLANARVQLSSTSGSVRTLGDQLRIFLGMDAQASLALGEDVLQPLPPVTLTAEDLESRALRARPETSALRALIETQRLGVSVQKGRQYPSLAITGAYDYANPNQRIVPQEDKFAGSWTAGVVLSWSPNDTIARKADVSRAELEVSRAQTDLVELERRIRNEASQAANDIAVAREQIAAAQEGVTAAREAWRVQRDLLGAGEATEQQALDAQAALTRAEQQLVDAQIAARIARARADYVVGRATPK